MGAFHDGRARAMHGLHDYEGGMTGDVELAE